MFEAHCDYKKMKYPKEMVTFWATFCLSKCFTFSPKSTVSKQSLLKAYKGFKSGFIKMFGHPE
jgi:hypothetical protein